MPKQLDMDIYTAVMIAEGSVEAEDNTEWIRAWQYLVDTGYAFRLQGFFGRQATCMLDAGLLIHPVLGKLVK